MFADLATFDLLFVFTAVAFNLLIAAIFIAQKLRQNKLVKTFGILWLWLIIPLALVFVAYWQAGKEARILLYFGLTFLYMLAELLLDYVFKIDFRSKPITHVPYIILEYIALFSLIAIAFDIDRRWGIVVSICFWILMGSLVFLYWDKIFKKK
ncbi:MAG: hypothetical protein AB8I58_05580 [Anaerolineales bacterium]|jgi:hypothetical protein